MSGMGIKFDDEILGLLLLNFLPQSWETFKVSVTNSAPNGVVSLQMVKGSVLNEEMKRKAQGSSSQSEVLVNENRGRSQKRESKGGRDKSRSKSKTRYKNIECHYCHKTGHVQKYCFLWKKENKCKKGKPKEKVGDDNCVTAVIGTGDDFVILCDFELVNLVSDESLLRGRYNLYLMFLPVENPFLISSDELVVATVAFWSFYCFSLISFYFYTSISLQ